MCDAGDRVDTGAGGLGGADCGHLIGQGAGGGALFGEVEGELRERAIVSEFPP